MQVPFQLQVAISTIEWLILVYTAAKLDIRAPGSTNNSSACAGVFDLAYHSLASFLFVLVLPSLGVLRLERSQRARYNALLQQQQRRQTRPQRPKPQQQQRCMGDSSSSLAAAGDMHALARTASAATIGTPTSAATSSLSRTSTMRSSSMRLSSDSDVSVKSAAAAAAAAARAFNTNSSSGVQLLHDIASSLQLAANASAVGFAQCSSGAAGTPRSLPSAATFNQTTAAAAAAAPAGDGAYPGSISTPATAAAAALGPLESLLAASNSSSGAASVLPDILPGLRGLLGAQEAASVFAAAAQQAAAQQASGASRPRSYKSMAGTLPVSIKVRYGVVCLLRLTEGCFAGCSLGCWWCCCWW
jgi:hypothetical protein